MPVTDPLITSYSTSGDGLFAGWPAHMARVIGSKIVEKWPDQAKLLSVLPRKNEIIDNRFFQWYVYVDRDVNSTPQAEITSIDDHAALTWEPFPLNNVSTVIKDKVQVGMAWEEYKKHYVQSEKGKRVRLAIMRAMRGVETNLWSGEFNNPTTAATNKSSAGLGVNAAGTGLRTVAGTKWTTDITDTNARMTQTDNGGAAWDEPTMITLLRAISLLSGSTPEDLFMDAVNSEITSGFIGSRDRIMYKHGEFQTERQIEQIGTEYGQVRKHLVRHNFPSRAVFALDLQPELIAWSPVKNLGIKLIPMGRRSDSDEIMLRLEYTLCVSAPHAHGFVYDTAA